MPLLPPALRVTLVGLAALALAMGIGRFAFTPLLPMMRADGLVDIVEGGWLASVHFLGYWLGAVTAARLPLAPRTALQVSLAAIGVGTLGMGLTDSFTLWLLLRWLTGLCSAWTLVLVSNHVIKHLAEAGRPAGQGWVFSGVGAGICLAGLACLLFMVQGIDSALSWQIVGGVTLIAVGAVALALGPELPATRSGVQGRGSERVPLAWRTVLAYGAMGLGYIIPATYLPVMAREIVSDPLVFGWSWPIFGAAAFVSTLLAARLYARYSNRQIWAVSQIVMAVGILLPVLHPNILTITAAGLSVGGTFMIVTMAGMKEAHRIAPPQDVARHIAVLTAAFATGQILGPLFASAVHATTQSFALALVATSLLLIVTAIALIGGKAERRAVEL